MAKYSPHSYPVHFADMDWQEDDSAQVALEMGGMSIDLDFPDKEISGGRSTGPYPEAANTDSMFAWLSKLLPGL